VPQLSLKITKIRKQKQLSLSHREALETEAITQKKMQGKQKKQQRSRSASFHPHLFPRIPLP
jgi:hypothetical protein